MANTVSAYKFKKVPKISFSNLTNGFIEFRKLLYSWLWFIIVKRCILKGAKKWDLFQACKTDSALKNVLMQFVVSMG